MKSKLKQTHTDYIGQLRRYTLTKMPQNNTALTTANNNTFNNRT